MASELQISKQKQIRVSKKRSPQSFQTTFQTGTYNQNLWIKYKFSTSVLSASLTNAFSMICHSIFKKTPKNTKAEKKKKTTTYFQIDLILEENFWHKKSRTISSFIFYINIRARLLKQKCKILLLKLLGL